MSYTSQLEQSIIPKLLTDLSQRPYLIITVTNYLIDNIIEPSGIVDFL